MATIWDDPDVWQIIDPTNGEPDLRLHDLQGEAQKAILDFIRLDQLVTASAPAAVTLGACLEGIRVFERFPSDLLGTNALGWQKFVLYMTAANAQILWEQHQEPWAAAVGGWVLEAMGRVGAGPDGFATALGSAYSATMAIHGAAAVLDPGTGQFVVRGGDDGRALAGV